MVALFKLFIASRCWANVLPVIQLKLHFRRVDNSTYMTLKMCFQIRGHLVALFTVKIRAIPRLGYHHDLNINVNTIILLTYILNGDKFSIEISF